MNRHCIEPTPLIRLRLPLDDQPTPEHWTLLGGGTEPFLKHDPTDTVFQIGYDPDLIDGGRVSVFVLYALLFYMDEVQPPEVMEIRRLGREAILVFWMLLTNRSGCGMALYPEVSFTTCGTRTEAADALQS